MMRLTQFVVRVAWTACICAPLIAFSQAFPVKPIRIVVPYEPGGAPDITARAIAPKMSEQLGQPVIIENRGGAGGQIGAQLVARSAPDGYTLLFTNGATHTFSMFAYKSLPYHPVKDFTPITETADPVTCLAANASFPPNSVKDLIEYAKRNPGKLFYGTTGIGGSSHLAMEQIKLFTGTEMEHVPFKGGAPLTINLLSGQIPIALLTLAVIAQHVRSGKIKLLALLSSTRYPLMPDVPTVTEEIPGFKGTVRGGTWAFGPAGLTQPVVGRLHAVIVAAMNAPEVREKFEAGAFLLIGNTPAEMAANIKSMTELGAKLFKAAGIEPE